MVLNHWEKCSDPPAGVGTRFFPQTSGNIHNGTQDGLPRNYNVAGDEFCHGVIHFRQRIITTSKRATEQSVMSVYCKRINCRVVFAFVYP